MIRLFSFTAENVKTLLIPHQLTLQFVYSLQEVSVGGIWGDGLGFIIQTEGFYQPAKVDVYIFGFAPPGVTRCTLEGVTLETGSHVDDLLFCSTKTCPVSNMKQEQYF